MPGTLRLRFSLTSLRVPPCKPSLRGVATCDPSAQLPTMLKYAVKIQLGRLEIWAPQTTLVFYLNKKCRGRVTDSLLSILRLTICFFLFFPRLARLARRECRLPYPDAWRDWRHALTEPCRTKKKWIVCSGLVRLERLSSRDRESSKEAGRDSSSSYEKRSSAVEEGEGCQDQQGYVVRTFFCFLCAAQLLLMATRKQTTSSVTGDLTPIRFLIW